VSKKAYQVAFRCKSHKCEGIVVESEWVTDFEAYAHLDNHKEARLTCADCGETHTYVPAIDEPLVQPWPVEVPKKRARVF